MKKPPRKVPKVNYIEHLLDFTALSKTDNRLHSNDIALYFSLFQVWNRNFYKNPFSIYRTELMQLSHIGSRQTYINCLRRLHDCGYIVYTKGTKQYELSSILMSLFKRTKTVSNDVSGHIKDAT